MTRFATQITRPIPDLELVPEERDLFNQIEFDFEQLSYETHRQNGERVEALVTMLKGRDVLPAQRVRWFTDPAFHPGGRGKSRQDQWARNGTAGRDILHHASFLKILRYFLCGPDLPAGVIADFRGAVDDCGMVTSGDIPVLSKRARALARASGAQDAEEYFKLALDCGLGDRATYIRDAVKAVR